MKLVAPFLLSLVSLAVAGNSSLDYDDNYSLETIQYYASEMGVDPVEHGLVKRGSKLPDGMCTKDDHCDNGEMCARFFCIINHPSLFPEPFCRDNSQCKEGYWCFTHSCVKKKPAQTCTQDGNYCIDHGVTAEAPPPGEPGCKTNADCGPGGRCMVGLCVAADKLRLTRRSSLTEDDKLKARVPQFLCHSDEQCREPGQPGGYCYNGICIADPPKVTII